MIAIVDYGVGNIFSLCCSFKYIGADAVLTSDADVIRKADRVLLPGVGAFGDAAAKLRENGLDKLIIERANAGVPLMGICLGMQMLFDESREFGCHKGLGLIPGKVISLEGVIAPELKIPQMGWNALHFPNAELKASSPVFCDIPEGEFVYFVHSFYAEGCEDSLLATTDYGREITAAVAKDNITGMQFHPEKSGEVGLNILRAFAEWSYTK